jgi:DNA-binding transcriptional MocR family regulator
MTGEQQISFARGAPSIDIVDVTGLKAAAGRAFDADPVGMTAYGTSVGYLPLRDWIANKQGVSPEHVIVTNGSMQADALLFDHLVMPGDAVVVEKPTYDRTLLNLRNAGATLYQVTTDHDGLDTGELRALLESGVRPKLVHVIPNYQNPSGVTLSAARRGELVGLAEQYEFTIFEDDPYEEIRFRGEKLPSMLSMVGAEGVVMHASSFTKTVCPGVRVGYLIGARQPIAAIATAATSEYISPSMVAQAIVYQFCVSGDIDRSIATVCAALTERSSMLASMLRKYIPGIRFTEPDGGYFLWVELPEDVSVARVFPAAAARGVSVVKGSDFLLEGGDHALRLAFSAVATDQIEEGVRRLAEAVREAQGS